MSKIIQLTMRPIGYPIAFDTTGIKIIGISQDTISRAIVNDIEVEEIFDEVVWLAREENNHG